MLQTLDRYILRQVIVTSAAMMGIALAVLLLERLLRVLERAVNADEVVGYVSRMLVALIPHYLGVALPLAFFLAVMLTFNRLNRDNEFAVMTAAGVGLRRMMAPVAGLALVLVVIAAFTLSYLQPLARYAYRSLIHTLAHASLSAAVKEGTFAHADGMTFIAESASRDGRNLRRVFVYEETDDGGSFVTTANDATLHRAADGQGSVLVLQDGRRSKIKREGGGGTLRFDRFQWPITTSEVEFRARGKDERELTLPELWAATDTPPARIDPAEARAELHARLVRMSSILVLPLLAVPLALGGGRGGQSYGIAVGLLILVVYEKTVKFGETMADVGHVTPWLGLWFPFAVLATAGAFLFYRAAFTVPKGRLRGLPPPAEILLVLRRYLGPRRWRRT
jgi:lipopolysaccharide export system permease protein